MRSICMCWTKLVQFSDWFLFIYLFITTSFAKSIRSICCGLNLVLVQNFSNWFNFYFLLLCVHYHNVEQCQIKLKPVQKTLNQGQIWTTTYTSSWILIIVWQPLQQNRIRQHTYVYTLNRKIKKLWHINILYNH